MIYSKLIEDRYGPQIILFKEGEYSTPLVILGRLEIKDLIEEWNRREKEVPKELVENCQVCGLPTEMCVCIKPTFLLSDISDTTAHADISRYTKDVVE